MSKLSVYVLSCDAAGPMRMYLNSEAVMTAFSTMPTAVVNDPVATAAAINAAALTNGNVTSLKAVPVPGANIVVLLMVSVDATVVAQVHVSYNNAESPSSMLAASEIKASYVAPMNSSAVGQAIAVAVSGALKSGL